MQITYPCLLPPFVIPGFESSQALFLFGTTFAVSVPFLYVPYVSKDFPVLSLWGLQEWQWNFPSFGCQQLSRWPSPTVPLVPPRLIVAESHCWQTDNSSPVCFRHRLCLRTTLLRGWLFQGSIILLHLVLFRSGFCIVWNLWDSFKEILLFPVFVLFCWRSLLPIFLFRQTAFMEGMFTVASVTLKNLPLEEEFPPCAIGRYHEARNIPCFTVVIHKEDNTL